jgi:hypothetical protein
LSRKIYSYETLFRENPPEKPLEPVQNPAAFEPALGKSG